MDRLSTCLGGGIRTHDLLHPMQARYQAAPHPETKIFLPDSFVQPFPGLACRGELHPKQGGKYIKCTKKTKPAFYVTYFVG